MLGTLTRILVIKPLISKLLNLGHVQYNVTLLLNLGHVQYNTGRVVQKAAVALWKNNVAT